MVFSEIAEGELEWHIIHEADDDNGQPAQWSAKLPNGEFLWIDKEAEGYALYDTHDTDASPVSVSETLDGAKESGEDYALRFACSLLYRLCSRMDWNTISSYPITSIRSA